MKKLTLRLEELAVDSFDPVPRGAAGSGTVFGHFTEALDCTHDPAYCNSFGPQTRCCAYTYDPIMAECYSYAEPCPASAVPTNCTNSQPTNYYCDSCRDSITACGP
jgi:hypothetical protein